MFGDQYTAVLITVLGSSNYRDGRNNAHSSTDKEDVRLKDNLLDLIIPR